MRKPLLLLIYILVLILVGGPAVMPAHGQQCDMQFDRAIFPSKSGKSEGVRLAADGSGNIYVAGTFQKQLKLGNHLLVGGGHTDVFIAKYNSAGEVMWVQTVGGGGRVFIHEFKFASGSFLLQGFYEKELYLSDTTLKAPSNILLPYSFALNLTDEGKFEKIKSGPKDISSTFKNDIKIIGDPNENPLKIDLNISSLVLFDPLHSFGKIVQTGIFSGTMTWSDRKLTSSSDEDAFMAVSDSTTKSGYWLSVSGKGRQIINDILILPSGDTYITGEAVPGSSFGHLKTPPGGAADSVPVFFLARISCGVRSDCNVPEDFRANKVTENDVILSWEETAETQAYDIRYRRVSDAEWLTRRTPNAPFEVKGLVSGEKYVFQIRKVCADGFSAYASDLQIKTLEPVLTCEAPADFSIRAVHPTFASVQWFEKGSYSQIEKYRIFYRKKGERQWNVSETTENSAKIENLLPLTEYEVKVSVTCKEGFKGDTTQIKKFTTIRTDACGAPYDIKAIHILHRSAHIRWAADEKAAGYRVQWKPTGKGDWQSANTSLNAIVLFGLLPDTPYEVRLRSKCGENSYSLYADPIVFKTLRECEPSATLLIPDVTLTTAWVVWDSVPNGKKYELFYKPKQDIYWKNVSTVNRYTQLTGLSPDTRYQLRLRVSCGDTTRSEFGPIAEASTLPSHACGTVENVVILPGIDHAVVRWKSAKLASGYILRWRCTNTSLGWTTVPIKDAQTRQYTIPNLTAGATYAVQIVSKCETVLQTFERTFTTMTDAKASASLRFNPFSAYPNPAKDKLKIDFNIGKEESAMLEVYDLVGRRVYTQSLTVSRGVVELDVSEWQTGVYFCRLYFDEERQYIQKIAVTK